MSDAYSFLPDWMGGIGQGTTGVPQDWAPQQPAQITVNPDTQTGVNASAIGGGQAAQAPPPQLPPSALGSLFGGLLGGGGGGLGAAVPAQPGAATTPGMRQSLIGLGLGMMSMPRYQFYGQPSRYAPLLQGYQRGAAADLAEAQRQDIAQYRGQELKLRQAQMKQTADLAREHMKLERDLATTVRPQFHFETQQLPDGSFQTRAFLATTGGFREMNPQTAEKISGQAGSNAMRTVPNLMGGTIQIPANINMNEFMKDYSKHAADVAAGKIDASQFLQKIYYSFPSLAPQRIRQQPTTSAAQPPTTGGRVPEGTRKTFREGAATFKNGRWELD